MGSLCASRRIYIREGESKNNIFYAGVWALGNMLGIVQLGGCYSVPVGCRTHWTLTVIASVEGLDS